LPDRALIERGLLDETSKFIGVLSARVRESL